MRKMPQVNLIGRIGNDLELKESGDTKILRLSISIPIRVKDSNTGTWIEETQWYEVTAFNNHAETIHKYCGKGSMIYLECCLKNEKWQDKQTGNTIKRLSLRVQDFTLLGNKQDKPDKEVESRSANSHPVVVDLKTDDHNVQEQYVDYDDDTPLPFI